MLKAHKEDLDEKNITLKEATVMSIISKAKARGQSADDFAEEARAKFLKHSRNGGTATVSHYIDQIVSEIYHGYEKTLRKSNCLDFDDLLLFGVRLFTTNQHTVRWCKHILVDEL
jgi:DNA helicase II / ATP-dependent DNA helicase PcrA